MTTLIQKETKTGRQLAPDEILQMLRHVYREEHVYITNATYLDGALSATARWFVPECYLKPPTHLTRIQTTSYFGMAAYLLGALVARDGLLPGIDETGYVQRISNDKATFRRLHLEFSRFIPPQDTVPLRIQCGRRLDGTPNIRRIRNLIVVPLLFEVGAGDCSGQSEAVLFA